MRKSLRAFSFSYKLKTHSHSRTPPYFTPTQGRDGVLGTGPAGRKAALQALSQKLTTTTLLLFASKLRYTTTSFQPFEIFS